MKKLLPVLILTACFATPSHAADKLKIVTSSSTFAEVAAAVAGDRAEVSHVASPKFNAHFIEPKPSDVRRARNADVFVFAGLDHEAWVDALLEAAGKPDLFRGGARNIELSEGIELLEAPHGHHHDDLDRSEGDIHAFGNPHYWLDPRNLKPMSRTLAGRLSEIDPAGASEYEANRAAFEAEVDKRVPGWQDACSHCDGKGIVSYHKDIAYLERFLKFHVEDYVEPKPGIPPSPKHLAKLEALIREHDVRAVVLASYYPREAADALAKKTGIQVRIIAQNVREVPEAGDLWSYYDYNVRTIAEVLK